MSQYIHFLAQRSLWTQFVLVCVALVTSKFLIADDELELAFVSCIEQNNPDRTIWKSLIQEEPDAVLFMGDNVYADTPEFRNTPNLEIARAEYEKLNQIVEFRELEKTASFHATWDDHDYLLNDGGFENALKDESQKLFMDFWQIPEDSERASTPGIYGADWVTKNNYQIQIILLDTRYFRSNIKLQPPTTQCPLLNFVPTDDPNATVLGEAQWKWLGSRLKKTADLHIIVSSIQVIPDEHCWERWGNMPQERDRLIELVANASAPALIVSGDRHLADISSLPVSHSDSLKHPLYEATSSPLSARSGFGKGDPNRYRVIDDNIRQSNYGVIEINTDSKDVRLMIKDQNGKTLANVLVID